MNKGEQTRQTILQHAMAVASQKGLEGLSIGTLASQLGLSKSGLFAHFRSKESLQIGVLDTAAEAFAAAVVQPALETRRGEARIRVLFERWLSWAALTQLPGGCIFAAASLEMDDRPGPVRDHLVKIQQNWFKTRVRIVQTALDEREFHSQVDPEQFAHDLYGIVVAYNHASRLLADPKAMSRARKAFEALIDQSQNTRKH